MRAYISLIIGLFFISITTKAESFEQKHYLVIKDIIWAADLVEVPRALLLAICWGEGSFRTDAKLTHMDGHSLSYGTCQVKMSLATHMDTVYKHAVKATPNRLSVTKINAFYAAKALKFHLKRYHGNWQLAVDAYNKYTAISENTEYVKKVKKSLEIIKTKVKAAR